MESQVGVGIRTRQGQRSQSKEPDAAKAPARREKSAHTAAIILKKPMHQAVLLVAVDGSTARRDDGFRHVREQFEASLEAARNGIEEELAETYQQKLDEMAEHLRREKESAAAANEKYRGIAQQLSIVQKANRDRENELSRLRDEYNNHKEKAEQRMCEMTRTIRENSVRYEQVVAEKQELVAEKQQLVELYTSFSVGIKASYDALKKAEEVFEIQRLHSAAPVRLADLTKSGQRKRKEPDDDASGSRMAGTPETTASAGTVATQPRKIRLLSPTQDTGEKVMRADDDYGGYDNEEEDDEPKRKGTVKKLNGIHVFCGICQKRCGSKGRSDQAVNHMLGASQISGPCIKWRTGELDKKDRQDYLLRKYPRKGIIRTKFVDGKVVSESSIMWTVQKKNGKRVILLDADKDDAKAAKAARDAAIYG